jgi:putative ABC transport system permease protein
VAGNEGRLRSYAVALVRVAFRRVRYRTLSGGARQTLLSVLGVALAVALLLSVTSVSLGLAAQDTVQTSGTDYWILPAESQGSAVVGVSETRFGRAHAVADRLEQRDDVARVTPVLTDIARVRPADGGQARRVFVVGVVPRAKGGSVVGLPTDPLRPGDPRYANGSYDGPWTGETVASASAASALNVSQGESLRVAGSDRSLSVVATSPAQAPGLAQFPVLVVHLAEAQQLAGGAGGDEADQFHVDTTDPSAERALAGAYPRSEVVSSEEMVSHSLQSSDLPLAMSLAAGIIALVVGVLTVVTTLGFELADDAESRAVLAAMGVSKRTRGALVVVETLATTVAGGLLGVGLWLLAVALINVAGQRVVEVPLAVVRPALGVYGVATALVVGLVSLPLLLLFTRRNTLAEALPTQ